MCRRKEYITSCVATLFVAGQVMIASLSVHARKARSDTASRVRFDLTPTALGVEWSRSAVPTHSSPAVVSTEPAPRILARTHMPSGHQIRAFRFGPFEADLISRRLRKCGRTVQLQDQPFQVLLALLDRPSELVTRHHI